MRLFLIVFSVFLFALGTVHAVAEKRVALVIGNSAYEHAPELANPSNDAAAVAARLEDLDFELVVRLDGDLSDMLSAVEEFSDKLRDADIALFYYAGHGLQVNGRNYLVPVNAKLESHFRLDYEAMPVNMVMAAMQQRAKTNLLFLDACRNNPMARSLARSLGTRSAIIGRGLARIGAGTGTFISFATEPGNVALDGEGENSPYTEALVRHLGVPGKGLAETMVQVRKDVIDLTDGQQVPWEHSSLTGTVVLREKTAEPEASAPAPAPDAQFEITFWNSIKDADSLPYFETYLEQFPQGRFASLAKLKIADLQRQEQARAKQSDLERAAREAESERLAALEAEKQRAAEEAPRIDPKEDREFVRSLQRELNRVGCSAGSADGVWGRNTAKGLANFGKHGEVVSLELTEELLESLKARKSRVCPLVCSSNQKIENGRCVQTGESGDPEGCLSVSVRVAEKDYLGRDWDVDDGVGPAPDILLEEGISGYRSAICQDRYSCTFRLRSTSTTLSLKLLDSDPHVKTRGPEVIGTGQCEVSSGRCTIGRASVRISPC